MTLRGLHPPSRAEEQLRKGRGTASNKDHPSCRGQRPASWAHCDPQDSGLFFHHHRHQQAPHSLVIREPAVSTGCERRQAQCQCPRRGRGGGQRALQAATAQSTGNSAAAEGQCHPQSATCGPATGSPQTNRSQTSPQCAFLIIPAPNHPQNRAWCQDFLTLLRPHGSLNSKDEETETRTESVTAGVKAAEAGFEPKISAPSLQPPCVSHCTMAASKPNASEEHADPRSAPALRASPTLCKNYTPHCGRMETRSL